MEDNRTATAEGIGLGRPLGGGQSPWHTVSRLLADAGIRSRPSNAQVLRQCSVFAGLTSGEIEKVAELAGERQFEAGSVIFRGGDRASEIFLLEEGRVVMQMMSSDSSQRAVTVDLAGPGELLGGSSLIEPHVHDLTATCLQGCRVLALDSDRLRMLLRDDNTNSKVMKGLARCVMSRLDDTRRLLVAERYWCTP